MNNTLDNLLKIRKEQGADAAHVFLKSITDKFTEIGVDKLCELMKRFAKYTNIPDWAKDGFLESKAFSYKQNTDGTLKELSILEYIKNPSDNNKHYYIEATLVPTHFMLSAGPHRCEVTRLINIEDIDDFLNF